MTHLVTGILISRLDSFEISPIFKPVRTTCSTMPVLKILTNLSRDKIPADFLEMATDFLAKLLQKDRKVCVTIGGAENNFSIL